MFGLDPPLLDVNELVRSVMLRNSPSCVIFSRSQFFGPGRTGVPEPAKWCLRTRVNGCDAYLRQRDIAKKPEHVGSSSGPITESSTSSHCKLSEEAVAQLPDKGPFSELILPKFVSRPI